jgi:hypothetical protein
MSRTEQCPVCFGPLEVRPVQPCYVCGGWTGLEATKPDHYFVIRDDGASLVLCHSCWLDEIVCDQGDLKEQLRISGENDLIVVSERSASNKDKFCHDCERRLALLKLIVRRQDAEPS